MNILKLFIFLLVITNAYISNAQCTDSKTKLTKKDGRVVQWDNCYEEGNNYCTQTTNGNICLQKKQFVSVETSNNLSQYSNAIIIDNEEKFKSIREESGIGKRESPRETREELTNSSRALKEKELRLKEEELRLKEEAEENRKEEYARQEKRRKELDREQESERYFRERRLIHMRNRM